MIPVIPTIIWKPGLNARINESKRGGLGGGGGHIRRTKAESEHTGLHLKSDKSFCLNFQSQDKL